MSWSGSTPWPPHKIEAGKFCQAGFVYIVTVRLRTHQVATSPRSTGVSGSPDSPVSEEFAESDPRMEPSCSRRLAQREGVRLPEMPAE